MAAALLLASPALAFCLAFAAHFAVESYRAEQARDQGGV